MSKYDLDPPYLWKDNKDWLLFPNSIFSDLNLVDCNDTIHGICYSNKSLGDCISLCAKEDHCEAGYHISGDNLNICVPINTDIHKGLNPTYRLRKKNIYPNLKPYHITTFINNKLFPFPPESGNTVFFGDAFFLQNINSGLSIQKPNNKDINRVIFSKNNELQIRILSLDWSSHHYDHFVPVHSGEHVIINIPGTSLILRPTGYLDNIEWISRGSLTTDKKNSFQIYSADPRKKPGDLLYYGENVYIVYQDIFLVEFNNFTNSIQIIHNTYDQALKNNQNIHFKFIPRIIAYYCSQNKCLEIPLDQVDTDGHKATYKGSLVSRSPSCWDQCLSMTEVSIEKQRKKRIIYILLAILILVIAYLIYKKLMSP